jgi:RHS repeat-associated protein
MVRKILPIFLFFLIYSTGTAFASEQVFFYHSDPAGTPLAMTDSSGNVVWKADYKPFGEENSTIGTASNDRRFVGKEKDEETGLSYFGGRYEDAKIGRFIAPDPVRAVDQHSSKTNEKLLLNPQRFNIYSYGLNNPYGYVDPDGKEPFTFSVLATAFFANLFLGSTANAPEYSFTPTLHAQSAGEFAGEVALLETGSFVSGRLLGLGISRAGLSITEQSGMIQFTAHGALQAAERGFTPERIARVMLEGKPVEAAGRYGPQIRYTLGENTVAIAKEGANANKVCTTFSSQTLNGIKGHWVEPN